MAKEKVDQPKRIRRLLMKRVCEGRCSPRFPIDPQSNTPIPVSYVIQESDLTEYGLTKYKSADEVFGDVDILL